MISDIEQLFWTCWPSVCLLGRYLFRSTHLLIGLLGVFIFCCCMSSVCTLDISSLSDMTRMFPLFHRLPLFILLVVFSAVQKLFSDVVPFVLFFFFSFGYQIQKIITEMDVKELTACVFI